jgi:hypothetical protein
MSSNKMCSLAIPAHILLNKDWIYNHLILFFHYINWILNFKSDSVLQKKIQFETKDNNSYMKFLIWTFRF